MAEIAFVVNRNRLPAHAILAYAVRSAMRVRPWLQPGKTGYVPVDRAPFESPFLVPSSTKQKKLNFDEEMSYAQILEEIPGAGVDRPLAVAGKMPILILPCFEYHI